MLAALVYNFNTFLFGNVLKIITLAANNMHPFGVYIGNKTGYKLYILGHRLRMKSYSQRVFVFIHQRRGSIKRKLKAKRITAF